MSGMDLVEFLRARLDEDEAAARNVDEHGPFTVYPGDGAYLLYDGTDPVVMVSMPSEPLAFHIARHDPARVLAEVAAKRALVEEHGIESSEQEYCKICDTLTWPCGTLRYLAAVYADCEGYDERWRP